MSRNYSLGNIQHNHSFFNYVTIASVAVVGTGFSFIVCSQLYKSMKRKYKNDMSDRKKRQKNRFERFLNSWKIPDLSEDSKCRKLSLDERKEKDYFNNLVVEMLTPVGMVLMRYNPEQNIFEYWCDSPVPYSFLIVVVRCFVTVYRCNYLYLEDFHDEFKENEDKTGENEDNENEEAKPLLEKGDEYLFLHRNGKEQDKQNSENEEGTQFEDNKNKDVEKKHNYFIFKKISSIFEYKEDKKKEYEHKKRIVQVKDISYKEFKNM